MSQTLVVLILSLVFIATSCRRDDQIQTYRVSKEEAPTMPMAGGDSAPPMTGAPSGDIAAMGTDMGMTPAASAKGISWKVPPGWKEEAPSTMRVGSFLVRGANGQTADVSVIPLSGEAGGDLANINRWREQINLDPLTESDLAAQTQRIKPGGRSMILVNFASPEPMINGRYKKRLIAAIYKQGERSWFFKMVGEDDTVSAAQPAFLQFLKSLHFNDER